MIELTEQLKLVIQRDEGKYTRFMCPHCGATVLISETDKLDDLTVCDYPKVCGHCKEKLNYA